MEGNPFTKTKEIKTGAQKASEALTKATVAIAKIVGDVEVYAEQVSSMTEQINIKTNELKALDVSFKAKEAEIKTNVTAVEAKAKVDSAEAKRTAKVNMDLDIKADEAKAVADLLAKRDEVAVPTGTVEDLETELAAAEGAIDEAVKVAVNKAEAKASNALKAAIETAELTHKVETADINAKLTAKDSEITSLTTQVKTLQKMIDDERTARVEVANATKAVVVNNG